MKHQRIYVDTSVIGGCLDDEFAVESRGIIGMARRGEAILLISDAVVDELLEAPLPVREVFDSIPDECLERVVIDEEHEDLQRKYIEANVVTVKAERDALHVAAATVARADML